MDFLFLFVFKCFRHWNWINALAFRVPLTEITDVCGCGEDGRVLYEGRAPPLVHLSSILISWIVKGGFCLLGLPDYSPLNVVMLWLCSVAKNILPGFFFTFDVSTGLISHLSCLRTLCQRTDSARSFAPSNVALAPFLPWKLRLSPWFSCQLSFLWIFEVRWGWRLNVHHTADVVQVLAQDLGLFTWH